MRLSEEVHSKLTILSVREWDSFQVIMRSLRRIGQRQRKQADKSEDFPHKLVFAILLMGILLPVTGTASAQDLAGEAIATMEEVVVTGTRYAEKIKEIPVNITVIDREDIDNSTAQNIPEILRQQVGVQVKDIGGNRRNYRVDIRGFGETAQSNVLVLVDNRRINQADLSGTDWSLIPLEQVERIEIIRGGRGSVLYGDNASGGVVNIITRGVKEQPVELKAEIGSFETFRTSLIANGKAGKAEYGLSAGFQSSEGYRDNSETEGGDLGLAIFYEIDERWGIQLKSGYHSDDTNLPGALTKSDFVAGAEPTDTVHPNDYADTDDYYISAVPELYFGQDSLASLGMSFRKRDVFQYFSFTGGYFEGDTEIETLAFAPQLTLQGKVGGVTNEFTMGYDYVRSVEDIHNISVFFAPPTESFVKLEKENHAVYLHEKLKILPELALSGGVRYDWAEFTFAPSTPSSTDMDEVLYTAGVNYNFTEKSQTYVSFARSFRYPVLDELFNFFTNTIMTGLEGQTSDDYEIGFRHTYDAGLFTSVNFFLIDTANEIYFNPATFNNENMDGVTRRQGVEVSMSKYLGPVAVSGSYTYTDACIEGGTYDGNDVPGVPVHQATLEGTYSFGKGFVLALNGRYAGESYFESDFANAFQEQEEYFVANAKLQYSKDRLTTFVNLNNLTNEEYSEYGVLGGFPVEEAYYPAPEFNVLVGLTIAFQ